LDASQADLARMSEGSKTIEVNLLGRTYRIACEDGEREALMQAVAYLDGKMNEIRKAGKVMGAERIAVMAALNVAHELLSVKLGAGFDLGHANRSSTRRLQSRRNCSKTKSFPAVRDRVHYFRTDSFLRLRPLASLL
jgi:cell division protein ZapA